MRPAKPRPARHKCAVSCVPPVPCAPSGSALGVAGFSRSRLDPTRCLRMIADETGTNLMECSQRRSRRLRHPARQRPSLPGHDLDGVGREAWEHLAFAGSLPTAMGRSGRPATIITKGGRPTLAAVASVLGACSGCRHSERHEIGRPCCDAAVRFEPVLAIAPACRIRRYGR